MKKKKLIIGFDLDGTLLDTMDLHADLFVETGRQLGIKVTKEQFFAHDSTTTADLLWHINSGLTETEVQRFSELKSQLFNKRMKEVRAFSDTVKTLHELNKRAKIIIFSNSHFKTILRCLEHAGINPFFFELIIGSDLVDHAKPEPDEIFIAEKIEHHKVDYFVGDARVDILTGKKAGAKTIAVATGYDSKEKLLKAKPYKVIDSLSELLDIIK